MSAKWIGDVVLVMLVEERDGVCNITGERVVDITGVDVLVESTITVTAPPDLAGRTFHLCRLPDGRLVAVDGGKYRMSGSRWWSRGTG